MNRENASSTGIVLLVICSLLSFAAAAYAESPGAQAVRPDEYKTIGKPGEKIPLGTDRYFIYGFANPPKLGTAVMRVEVFTRDGRRDLTVVVKGDVDMPSMRGAHSTGNKPFSLSAKGVYLLPVPIVMPGDWEFRFTFEKDGKVLLRGAYLFDV